MEVGFDDLGSVEGAGVQVVRVIVKMFVGCFECFGGRAGAALSAGNGFVGFGLVELGKDGS